MKLALSCFFFSILLPVLLTTTIYCLFWRGSAPNFHVLPRTCVPVTSQQSSIKGTSLICYSCLRRDVLKDKINTYIKVSSYGEFNYIGFEEDIKEYSCDQLFQMVDFKSYIEVNMFKLQDLQSIYQTMVALKGKANKIPIRSVILPNSTKTALLIQTIAIIEPQSYVQSLARTQLKLTIKSSQQQQTLLSILSSMSVISCSMLLLLILYRQYKDWGFQFGQVLKILSQIVVFLTIRMYPYKQEEIIQSSNKYVELLFLLVTILKNPQYKYFLPCTLFILASTESYWLFFAQWTFFLIYLQTFSSTNLSTHQQKYILYQLFTLLLFVFNKTIRLTSLSQKQITFNFICYWVILIYSQLVQSIIDLFVCFEKVRLALERESEDGIGQEEIYSLKKANE